jgi:glycosyltransferase involved in cell wall biosynthesis
VRVVVLHSPFQSGPASGENRVVEEEIRLLREAGHSVTAYIPPRLPSGAVVAAREGFSAVWSRSAAARVRRLVRAEGAEIVHAHNLFPALSPAVLRAAADEGVPVVLTLHSYRLLCLPATFLRSGRTCELCLGRLPWRGVVHRCYRGSTPGSASLATSLAVHRAVGTFDRVTLYVAVSDFLRSKYLAAGFPLRRMVVKPNWAWPGVVRSGPGEYFLFLGRLSREKGVERLLQAWHEVDAPLLVVGDGPEAGRLHEAAPPGVRFAGQVAASEVPGLLSRARALILPSLSYEGSPLTILEAYAAGVPVLASAIGGLPEHVRTGESGVVFPAGDAGAIARAVDRLLDDGESKRLGAGALKLWHERFSPEQGLAELEAAYRRALELGRS